MSQVHFFMRKILQQELITPSRVLTKEQLWSQLATDRDGDDACKMSCRATVWCTCAKRSTFKCGWFKHLRKAVLGVCFVLVGAFVIWWRFPLL